MICEGSSTVKLVCICADSLPVFRRGRIQEVPDKLCCPITMEVYREPVIALSGQSFECAPLLHHLSRNGELDPVTRESLKVSDLRPNLALRVYFLFQHS